MKLWLVLPVLIINFARAQTVDSVLDADTWIVGGKHVRLIGIDAPETYSMPKLYRDAKRYHMDTTEIKRRGRLSTKWAKRYEKKVVSMKSDPAQGDTDRYGRLLRYIYYQDKMVNREMIREGYAYVYPWFKFKYKDSFYRAQKWAKKHRKGLWKLSKRKKNDIRK